MNSFLIRVFDITQPRTQLKSIIEKFTPKYIYKLVVSRSIMRQIKHMKI